MLSLLLLFLSFSPILIEGKPNFLFLQCDSMDGRVIDPTSPISLAPETPNLDALAAQGVNFIRSYSPSPQCVPSRSAMWTSKRVDQIKTWNNYQGLCKARKGYRCVDTNVTGVFTLISDPLLRDGWSIKLFGKTDYLGVGDDDFQKLEDNPKKMHAVSSGLEAWTRSANITKPIRDGPEINDHQPETSKKDWETIEKCVQFLQNLENNPNNQSFFLYCSVNKPHPQYQTNATWLARVNESAISLPKWLPFDSMHPFNQYMSISKCVLSGDCTGENASPEQILKIRKIWYAMVAETDAMMGHVIDALKHRPDIANNTYIIFTSDHGEMNMEHRQWLKNAMFEASTRVPLIISGPGIVQGKLVKNLTSLLDIFPTIMELGGVSFDEDIEGFSLAPFLRETDHPIQQQWKPIKNTKKQTRPDHVVSQFHSNFGNTGSFMIRKGPWKYIAFGPTPPYHYRPQLFNVDQDPEELSDLVSDFPDVATNLDQLLLSIIDYPTVDAEVKKQDLENYLTWVQDGNEDDPWTDFWAKTYRGFDEQDKAKVKEWISRPTQL